MKHALFIGFGGFLGSIARHLLGNVIQQKIPLLSFPLGTFTVNVLGCFLIGIFSGLVDRRELLSTDLRLFLVTGFCGGFTTFSAFANENFHLLRKAESSTAILYITVSVLLCLFAVWLGYKTTAAT